MNTVQYIDTILIKYVLFNERMLAHIISRFSIVWFSSGLCIFQSLDIALYHRMCKYTLLIAIVDEALDVWLMEMCAMYIVLKYCNWLTA